MNPVTGEGIDYALESGKLAAERLTAMFAADDFSINRLRAYDAQLRADYQRLFTLCDRLRLLYLNAPVINRAISAGTRRQALRDLYMNIVMENDDVMAALSPRTLATVAFGEEPLWQRCNEPLASARPPIEHQWASVDKRLPWPGSLDQPTRRRNAPKRLRRRESRAAGWLQTRWAKASISSSMVDAFLHLQERSQVPRFVPVQLNLFARRPQLRGVLLHRSRRRPTVVAPE